MSLAHPRLSLFVLMLSAPLNSGRFNVQYFAQTSPVKMTNVADSMFEQLSRIKMINLWVRVLSVMLCHYLSQTKERVLNLDLQYLDQIVHESDQIK